MKGMKRTLALVLSAAVAVTSISVNWEMTSYAAAPEAGAETGDAASKAASLISWQTDNFAAEDGYTVTGNVLQHTEEFYPASMDNSYDDIYAASPNNSDNVIFDAAALAALWPDGDGPAAEDISTMDLEFSYQWQEIGEDGNYVDIPGETYQYYTLYDDVTNAKLETKYRCVETLTSISGVELPTGEGIEPIQLIYEKVYRYTGPTEEKVNDGSVSLGDYFVFGDEAFPSVAQTLYYGSTNGSQYAPDESYEFETGNYENKVSYRWDAYAVRAEGEQQAAKAEVSSDTNTNYIDSPYLPFMYDFTVGDATAQKQVDYYELSVDFYYGSQKLATRTVRYDVRVDAIGLNTPAENKLFARKGETKKLSVEAELLSDEIGNLTYQWYKVPASGQPQLLEKFNNSDTVYVKVDDYTAKYKCVVSADRLQEAFPGIVMQEISCMFTPAESAGYRLKAIDERPRAALGGPAEMSIKAVADAGYTLEYKWEKASYQDNDSSKGIVFTPVAGQTTAVYKIAATKEEDFDAVYDENLDYGDGASYTHRLTVSVKRGTDKVGEDAYYYFRLRQDGDVRYKIECNFEDGDALLVQKGEDVELTCKTESVAPFTLEKAWYKMEEVEFVAKKDANGDYVFKEDGEIEYVQEDASVTVPSAAVGEKTEEWPYDYMTDPKTGKSFYAKKRVTYYTKLTATDNDSTLKLSGANDIRGTYLAEVTITEKAGAEQTVVDTWRKTYYVTIAYETGLKAYAKTERVKASVGGTASLEVVASNRNETLYPIKYQWQKRNAAGDFEDIKDAVSKTFAKSGLKQEDFGEYRVKVSDLSQDSIYVEFSLIAEGQEEPVFHTPLNSYFKKAIGETAELEVKADIPASAEVAYNWYRTEHYIKYYEPMYWEGQDVAEDKDWQILNAEAAKYAAPISSEEDFCTYKCVARYKINGAYKEEARYFHVENSANEIFLERTTPSTQYKQLGDSASYGVRYKAVSAAIKDSDVKYQWYDTDGEKIAGAESATYTVASLQAKDIGTIYCEVTYSDTNLAKMISFTTNVYSEVKAGYGEPIYTHVGEDVNLKAEVVNPANRTLTYQWGFDSDSWLEGNDGIIYGATSDTYTIAKIGGSQFGTYFCNIYDGDLIVATYHVYVTEKTLNNTIEIGDYESQVSVITGKEASFKVDAKSEAGQKLFYQWEYCSHEDDDYDYDDDDDYMVIHDYKAIGGAVEASYSIPCALPSMEGTYRCVITDEEGNRAIAEFNLEVGSKLEVDSGSKYDGDTIGYQTTVGGSVTLKANATIGEGYQAYYQWFKLDDEDDDLSSSNVIYNATANELKLTNIKMDDIGYYVCKVTDAQNNGSVKYLRYLVYINTGLVVEPSVARPVQAKDGSLTMFVQARANKGETISYQWKKEGEIIPNATASSYKIPKILKESLGYYSCTVSTSGESYTYDYNVTTMFSGEQSREFALQGDSFTMNMSVINAATDAAYTYQWYAQDAATGAQMRTDCKTAEFSAKAPSIKMGGSLKGYVPLTYVCEVYRDGELVADDDYTLNVLPEITFSTSALPQTNHPFDKRIDVKAYKLTKAKNIKITLDKNSEWVTVIDAAGHAYSMSGLTDNVLTLTGNSAIFIMENSSYQTELGYGYKVASIVDANPVTVKPVPAKGKKYKVGNLSYQVTKSDKKSGTVSVIGAKNKKVTSVTIPETVKINGYTFKVTKVAAKAFNGYKKLKSATVGKNVTAIDKEAFKGCSALAKITIKGTKLKSVGKNALKGIKGNAKVKVPSSKLKAYKNLFKGKGQGKKVKIQK